MLAMAARAGIPFCCGPPGWEPAATDVDVPASGPCVHSWEGHAVPEPGLSVAAGEAQAVQPQMRWKRYAGRQLGRQGKTMTLTQLTYFAQVAKLEHMTRAAQELNISQSSLSSAVKQLEEELGVALFERRGRALVLTDAGRAMLAHAGRILGDVRRAEREMEAYAVGREIHLNLGYIAALAQDYLPQLVRRFLEKEPGVHISVSFVQDATPQMIQALKDGRYDLVFGSDVEDGEGLCCLPLLEHPLVVICPYGHPLCGSQTVALRQLEPYPFISYDPESSLGRKIMGIFASEGLEPRLRYQASDEAAITALVAEGFGVSVVAQLPTLADAPVEVIPLEGGHCRRVCLAYLRDRRFPPAVRRMIEFIQAQGGMALEG